RVLPGEPKAQKPEAQKMQLSESEGIEGNTFMVTGGAGFVGTVLCLELMRRGADEVRSLDLRKDSPWITTLRRNGVVCIAGDISRNEDVEKALRGADCVFHLASYGMSAIYGPGEERHLPRIFRLAQMGLLTFTIGEPRVKNDWVYADNPIHALLLA
ncbi:hypothetical protein KI387_040593, partial [Taxus chinensis]